MLKLHKLIELLLLGYKPSHIPLREKFIAANTAGVAIFCLLLLVDYIDLGLPFKMLVLASMGASAFLLFVVPHSPLAQPWPVIGGHVISAFIGVACAHSISGASLATALAVFLSVLMMYQMHCLHPPSAATALIAVLGGPEVHAMGWQFCYEVVALNAIVMVLLAVILNNLVRGRQYPMRHLHHAHHTQFSQQAHTQTELNEQDFKWALSQMDGYIDVNEEDLVDLYEFALEHAQTRQQLLRQQPLGHKQSRQQKSKK
jgi:CBS-domain-containing membrane protein